ncbi:hypothetical protein ACFQFC_30995 [Amorphoplanes digitatis]|uniref:Uncharacterized protein n=1 Tax=Actinoplanes digitatis TaxID=1868 RepID=A0A7W7HTQ7_9ACTN|nr:hypothetical protein [Actinoplanes digitatis]MBB4760585.1 hypothetical protein [Actinoplanes digitatis]GID97137.1 hypothetical protein Adi01nite_65490 [Actinoplanes digitatis]
MIWKGRPGEVAALGLLLDRTYAEVAAAGAHPHRLDRPALLGQFELWDTHLLPAVAAAGAPVRERSRAARAVWHGLGAHARPELAGWLRAHLTGLGLEPGPLLDPAGTAGPPPGPVRGRVGTLAVLQTRILERLGEMRDLARLRRWELAAAGAVCAGLGTETMHIAGGFGGTAHRERSADRRLRTLVEGSDGPARAFLRTVAAGLDDLDVPEAAGEATPAPERITVGTAGRLLDGLDFTGARIRAVDGADPAIVQLDLRRADQDREAIGVIVLNVPRFPALDVPPDGLALTGRPRLTASADDIELAIPLAGGDWTVSAAAGTWYAD